MWNKFYLFLWMIELKLEISLLVFWNIFSRPALKGTKKFLSRMNWFFKYQESKHQVDMYLMAILKFIYFLMHFGILLPKVLLYFKYRVNMHCCGTEFHQNFLFILIWMSVQWRSFATYLFWMHQYVTKFQWNSLFQICS